MRNGMVATCTKINFSDVRCVEISAMSGVDCVWVDMEHIPNDYSFIENAARAAKLYDCDLLTRVPNGSYSDIIRPLEGDSTGVMVPHVMSLENAKRVAYYTKFHPIGRRPLDGGNADGKYCLVDADDYLKEANEERFTIIQIEDPEPMDELEEICRIPGIDMIFFGPADFSQGAGVPNQFGSEIVLDAKKRVAECARKNGKFAGTTGGIGNFDSLVDMGYTFISVGADVIAISDYTQNIAKQISGRKIK